MSTIRLLHDRWASVWSLLLAVLLIVPMGRHERSGVVVCVESNGTLNVERARGTECAEPPSAASATERSNTVFAPSDGEHCTECVDLPLYLAETHEPCESAVMPASVLGEPLPQPLLEGQSLRMGDLQRAWRASQSLQPDSPDASPASYRRNQGHLFSNTSVVRAKSSVELLI